uniref:FAM21/CAPZIP domain-containing protein n=1 Tax=Anopheles atroparvus TaxID=41427 RepID=A0AAG5DY06_ANOAO
MAFTPEELRQRIPTWSLESDGHLLQYMISIAKNLEEKCTNTRDNLDRLMLQVNQTELKLSTATNQFSAVEQVKFVENRVEEDDESFYGLRRRRQQQQQQQQQVVEGKEGAKQEPDAERSFDDLIQLAVERSIEGMYQSYEKVTLQLTDSDTSDGEDGSDSTRMADSARVGAKASVMRAVPRHPFIDRPLPHVIGSKEWQNKWHVGLIDSDDESSSDRKEEYSESSSTDTDDGGMFPSQPNSKNHTPSESESSIWGTEVGRKRVPSMDPSITGDDGSSVYSYASSSKPRTFPATLPVRGMGPIGASLKPPSLFPEEPPEMVDNGKRSSDKGLFDESPEEEEEAEEPMPMPKPRQTVPTSSATAPFFKGTVHQPSRKMVNLFDDEPPSPQEPRDRAGPEPKKAINLFIESDEEEETKENVRNNNMQSDRVERTVAKSSNVGHSGPPAANPRTMTRLVDELNNNFRKQQPATQPGTIVGNGKPERALVSNIFDNEPPVDNFDQLFSAANRAVQPTPRNALPQPTLRTVEKKTVNLFADDDDDGIVVGSVEKNPEPARSPFISPNHQIVIVPKQPERPRGPTSKNKSIFDDSDSDAEKDEGGSGLFAGLKRNQPSSTTQAPLASGNPQPPKAIKSIFSDSSEEEDDDDALFGHSSNVVKNKLDALKRNGPSSASAATPVTLPSRPSVSQPMSTKTDRMEKEHHRPEGKGKTSLFDDDSDGEAADPLFNMGSREPAPTDQKQEPAKVSLFDDGSTTDDDQQGSRNSTASGQMALGGGTEHATKHPNPTDSSVVNVTSLMKQSNRSVDRDPLEAISEPMDTNVPSRHPTGIVPETPAGSIRSLIMKKSIFNSDSESEEDDAIFGPSTSSVPAEAAAAGSIANGQMAKIDAEARSSAGVPLRQDAPMVGESELISKAVTNESILQPTNSGVTESGEVEQKEILQESSNDDKTLDDATADNSDKKTKKEPPTIVQRSIFADSSSESEADADLSMFVNEVKNSGIVGSLDREADNRSSGTLSVDVVAGETQEERLDPTAEPEISTKDDAASKVALESSQPALNGLVDEAAGNAPKQPPFNPIVDDVEIPVDREPSRTIAPEGEDNASPEPPRLGMIANDIDYFLRTNESRPVTPPPAVKSEPKSALNFSPIGLFDDVPPPDDEDDVDVHETQKHFHPVDTSSSLPPVDDTPAFPTESQSLNFIPNGAGNGRTRYLFDDEPPPDEADNSGLGFGEPYPFRGASSTVSHFEDHRQRTVDAPVSLPPMVQDTQAKAQARPKINKLNAKIAINVAALLPGARRPPASSGGSVKGNADVSSAEPLETTSASSTQPLPAAATNRTNGDKLTSLNKGRARIPTKRKPPSRQTLRAAAAPSEGHQKKDTVSLETDDRVVVGSEQKILHIEGDPTKPAVPTELPFTVEEDEEEEMDGKRRANAKLEPLVDRLSASVRNPSARTSIRPDGNEETAAPAEKLAPRQPAQTKSTSIFGDSADSNDEGDDTRTLFGGKAAGPAAPAKAVLRSQPASKSTSAPRSIFGSDDDDDTEDIFGGKKSTVASHHNTSKSTNDATGRRTLSAVVVTKANSVKPPPPAKGPTSLFGDDGSGSDDSDDLFGGKTNTFSKPPGTQAPVRSITTTTTKAASATRTVNDPLADLLDS